MAYRASASNFDPRVSNSRTRQKSRVRVSYVIFWGGGLFFILSDSFIILILIILSWLSFLTVLCFSQKLILWAYNFSLKLWFGVNFLKNGSIYVRNSKCILKKTFYGTQKLHYNFSSLSGFWVIDQNRENIVFGTFLTLTQKPLALLKYNLHFWIPWINSD